jgi:hypothetical protein
MSYFWIEIVSNRNKEVEIFYTPWNSISLDLVYCIENSIRSAEIIHIGEVSEDNKALAIAFLLGIY